jgi:hypothetical protein
LGIDERSLVLVLEVELATFDKPKIMYEDIFEGDEVAMLMWLVILDVGHY